MRKRNFLILLLLSRLWPVIGVSAQDAWKITAEQIEPSSYYGITVANGMLGLVSSPDPLKISRVVLGGLYDIYGKGRVNNFLHGINMLDTELQINGTTVKASQISGYKQTLDMRQGFAENLIINRLHILNINIRHYVIYLIRVYCVCGSFRKKI